MNIEQYTADAICYSMGIGPFIDPTWSPDTLAIRLLLKPSFHPEACITVYQAGGVASLSAVVLTEMLWRQQQPCHLPAFHDQIALPKLQFVRLAHYHHEAMRELSANQVMCLDGMSMNCAWNTADGHHQSESLPIVDKSLCTFVAQMINQAWRSSTNSGLRNGLAECARYVGAKYPTDLAPAKPIRLRIGLFGTPDDVDEYFRSIEGEQKEHDKPDL